MLTPAHVSVQASALRSGEKARARREELSCDQDLWLWPLSSTPPITTTRATKRTACDRTRAALPCAGKYMLAHAASAQGISAVENMCGRPYVLNHNSVPAACFTHPEVRPEPYTLASKP